MSIAVLLSGGVDSSVALYEILKKGYKNIKCYYLRIWLEDELSNIGSCPWEEDLKYVREVCKKFNTPYEIINLQEEYYKRIVSYTIEELKNGNTPNPDIFCNKRIKFGAFFDKLNEKCDLIVTGHYSKIEKIGNKYYLKQAKDKVKDQSYFLSYLSENQLSKLYFPLENMLKSEVKKIAEDINLPNKLRKDSQGICFLGKIKYNQFARHYLGEKEGDVIEKETGKILGKHKGYWFFTIGQRKGIELGNGPWFVIEKDIKNNIIYISHNDNYLKQNTNKFLAYKANWINEIPSESKELTVKIRHGEKKIPCNISFIKKKLIKVNLKEKDSGIAPGQFSIFYDNDTCIGGAKILKSLD